MENRRLLPNKQGAALFYKAWFGRAFFIKPFWVGPYYWKLAYVKNSRRMIELRRRLWYSG